MYMYILGIGIISEDLNFSNIRTIQIYEFAFYVT
jgi:hypothetical protein